MMQLPALDSIINNNCSDAQLKSLTPSYLRTAIRQFPELAVPLLVIPNCAGALTLLGTPTSDW